MSSAPHSSGPGRAVSIQSPKLGSGCCHLQGGCRDGDRVEQGQVKTPKSFPTIFKWPFPGFNNPLDAADVFQSSDKLALPGPDWTVELPTLHFADITALFICEWYNQYTETNLCSAQIPQYKTTENISQDLYCILKQMNQSYT